MFNFVFKYRQPLCQFHFITDTAPNRFTREAESSGSGRTDSNSSVLGDSYKLTLVSASLTCLTPATTIALLTVIPTNSAR